MPTPREVHHPNPDPEVEKRHALRQAAHSAKKAASSERALRGAIVFASSCGASLREIEGATGIPFNTVKRILDRVPAV
jgi:hypothetical protein